MIRDNGDVVGVENGGDETGAVENTQKQCDCRNVGFRMGIDIEMEMPAGATGQTLRGGNCVIPSPAGQGEDFWSLRDAEARWYGNGGDLPAWLLPERRRISPGMLKVGPALLLLHRLGRQQRKTA